MDQFKETLKEYPMTLIIGVVFVIVTIVGGVLVIFGEAGTLSFEDYLDKLVTFALAAGILGAGKAIKKGLGAQDTPSMLGDEAEIEAGAIGHEQRDIHEVDEDLVNPRQR